MEQTFKENPTSGQTAVEYLLLLGVVTAIVFAGFKTILPSAQTKANAFVNVTREAIRGGEPDLRIGGQYP